MSWDQFWTLMMVFCGAIMGSALSAYCLHRWPLQAGRTCLAICIIFIVYCIAKVA